MKNNEQNHKYESLAWMITPDTETAQFLTHEYNEQCYALVIKDLKCGIWFAEHSAGVYGNIETQPFLSSFWDFYADDIGLFAMLENAGSFTEKTYVVLPFLVLFLDKLQSIDALENLKKRVAA